ncbi:MAG: phosphoribosylaminoimidazolesuccinocarboxamide synthase [Thermoplasmata archaeon]
MKLLRSGKVKDVYEVGEGELEFRFSDRISVFDVIIPTEIPRKGEVLCKISAFWFRELENLGIRTHFLDLKGPNRMRVKRTRIPGEYEALPETNYMIPVEWINRHYVAGSLHRRLVAGEISALSLGFDVDEVPEYGERLPSPFFEQTTKFETHDRAIGREEALELGGMSDDEYDELRDAVLMIDELIENGVKDADLTHVDGKKEFAFDENRNLMVVDTLGTPDEDRFWQRSKMSEGRFIEMSKEPVRKYYESIGYLDDLTKAREKELQEPPIPPLPAERVESTSGLYVDVYERITGEPL